MPKDLTQAAANRTTAGWDKRTSELTKKVIRKQQAQDQGEETSSEDDDDDDKSDEEAAGVDWGDLVNEDSLPTQGPFPFHAEGSESMGAVEPGPPLGPMGAGGSAATVGVSAEDRWMGGVRSETVPAVLVEGGGSDAMP